MNHQQAPIGDELLSAWLDDELATAERERVAAALTQQPALAARLEALRLANELTRRHAQAIDTLPLTLQLNTLLQASLPGPAATAAPAGAARVLPWPQRLRRWQNVQPLALAAGLLLAVGLSWTVLQRTGSNDAVVMEMAVNAALLEQIASGERVQLGDLALSPRFSFRSAEGQWCRLYRVDAPTLSSDEVACRGTVGWELRASLPATSEAGSQYLPASSDNAGLDTVLDALMQGAPLPLASEAELIRQGWNSDD